MITCAIYVRVSTVHQQDKDSIPMQKKQLIDYATFIGANKYEIFEDVGFSGKNTERPAFQEMINAVRQHKFTHILVWKLDRISRNLIDFANMYDEFKRLGVTFVSLNEQFDTSTAMGEAMLKIILVFAELERNMTSERVTSVMLNKATNGEWNGGRVPFGYTYDKKAKKFEINKSESAIVKKIYAMYANAKSLLVVSRALNESGTRTRAGKPWSPVTVQKILNSPFYLGDYLYDKNGESIRVTNHHPAIIDKDTQSNVIEILTSQQRNAVIHPSYNRKAIHIFAGLLECGNCGATMQATTGKQSNSGYVASKYGCASKRRFNACTNPWTTDKKIAPFVLNYIANIVRAQNNFGASTTLEAFERKLLRTDVFKDVEGIEPTGLLEMYNMLKAKTVPDTMYTADKYVNVQPNDKANEISYLEQEKRKLKSAFEKLVDGYANDLIPLDIYKQKSATFMERLTAIDKQLKALSVKDDNITDEELLRVSSFFYLSHGMLKERSINFNRMCRDFDLSVVKDFVINVVKKIVITDGKITQIQFQNGITHTFIYKEKNPV